MKMIEREKDLGSCRFVFFPLNCVWELSGWYGNIKDDYFHLEILNVVVNGRFDTLVN